MVVNVTMAVVVSVTAMYMNNFRMSVVTGDVLRGVSVSMSVPILSSSKCDESEETKYLKFKKHFYYYS